MKTATLKTHPGKVTHLWMDPVAETVEYPTEIIACPLEQHPGAFHLYNPVTRMPFAFDKLPSYRAMLEGMVRDAYVLRCPPGEPEVLLHVNATAAYDEIGDVIGVALVTTDVTGLQHVGVDQQVDYAIHMCPCDRWQLDHPVDTPLHWVKDALEEHMDECVVLAATRLCNI